MARRSRDSITVGGPGSMLGMIFSTDASGMSCCTLSFFVTGGSHVAQISISLVVAIWAVAKGRLVSIVETALNTVCGGLGC